MERGRLEGQNFLRLKEVQRLNNNNNNNKMFAKCAHFGEETNYGHRILISKPHGTSPFVILSIRSN
jgi:hypothetical protein